MQQIASVGYVVIEIKRLITSLLLEIMAFAFKCNSVNSASSLIELIFKPVLMYLNVFSYWHYLQNYI